MAGLHMLRKQSMSTCTTKVVLRALATLLTVIYAEMQGFWNTTTNLNDVFLVAEVIHAVYMPILLDDLLEINTQLCKRETITTEDIQNNQRGMEQDQHVYAHLTALESSNARHSDLHCRNMIYTNTTTQYEMCIALHNTAMQNNVVIAYIAYTKYYW
jgi:hypothetical protein